jgi:hypothetical protein
MQDRKGSRKPRLCFWPRHKYRANAVWLAGAGWLVVLGVSSIAQREWITAIVMFLLAAGCLGILWVNCRWLAANWEEVSRTRKGSPPRHER